MEHLTSSIKLLRVEHGITQEQLAERVGVARQTIVYLEKSEYMPSLALAWRIASYFNKTIDAVFTFSTTEDLIRTSPHSPEAKLINSHAHPSENPRLS